MQACTQMQGQQNMKLLNIIMELKKCCNHPFLFPQAEVPRVTTSVRMIQKTSPACVSPVRVVHALHYQPQASAVCDIHSSSCVILPWDTGRSGTAGPAADGFEPCYSAQHQVSRSTDMLTTFLHRRNTVARRATQGQWTDWC
jgi:hypothetical protein